MVTIFNYILELKRSKMRETGKYLRMRYTSIPNASQIKTNDKLKAPER